jgi:K+-sensing histidine kinase KdpD
MEVHHHSHHPKKWKEYITEFIMLFAAVTLGFLAENFREHQIIEHRIELNKIAILKDLQADSTEIARVISVGEEWITKFNKVNQLLYLAKSKKISQDQLIDSIKNIPDFYARTRTLYMNNSSFKNMQSSGLFTSLEESELKHTLSIYYEVDFKALESLNEFFDQTGNVFNNTLPMGLCTLIRERNNFPTKFNMNNPDEYENFILSLPKTKALLQSDDFIYEVQKYYNYIFLYRTSLRGAKKSNETLIKLLKAEIK